jgi:hypothetical protein
MRSCNLTCYWLKDRGLIHGRTIGLFTYKSKTARLKDLDNSKSISGGGGDDDIFKSSVNGLLLADLVSSHCDRVASFWTLTLKKKNSILLSPMPCTSYSFKEHLVHFFGSCYYGDSSHTLFCMDGHEKDFLVSPSPRVCPHVMLTSYRNEFWKRKV